ncbi:hypothetical protein ACJMK2_020805 [Sinanodonta woodiana]|uniref:LRRNT domain-containing protein n=1 Tax=Sinanodonta woodiana TaxID=1069815 RepID=A0ABD3U1W8_SINWO
MFESCGEILALSLFMLLYIVTASSDCPISCDCGDEAETVNLSCKSTIPYTLPLNTRVVNIIDIEYKHLNQSHFNHTRWANVTNLYLSGKSVTHVADYTFLNVTNLTHLQISFDI